MSKPTITDSNLSTCQYQTNKRFLQNLILINKIDESLSSKNQSVSYDYYDEQSKSSQQYVSQLENTYTKEEQNQRQNERHHKNYIRQDQGGYFDLSKKNHLTKKYFDRKKDFFSQSFSKFSTIGKQLNRQLQQANNTLVVNSRLEQTEMLQANNIFAKNTFEQYLFQKDPIKSTSANFKSDKNLIKSFLSTQPTQQNISQSSQINNRINYEQLFKLQKNKNKQLQFKLHQIQHKLCVRDSNDQMLNKKYIKLKSKFQANLKVIRKSDANKYTLQKKICQLQSLSNIKGKENHIDLNKKVKLQANQSKHKKLASK